VSGCLVVISTRICITQPWRWWWWYKDARRRAQQAGKLELCDVLDDDAVTGKAVIPR